METRLAAESSTSHAQGYSGTIEEEYGSSLSFSAMGTVQRVLVSAGQTVGKGTLIAEVDPATVRNTHNAAVATLEQAQDAYNRLKQLHDAGSLSEIKWIEAESKLKQAVSAEKIARKGVTDTKLYAPFAGYVAEKSVEVGQNVVPGMQVVKIVRIDRVKVKVAVPEEEIASIKCGQTANITVAALGQRAFTGRVVEKDVTANPLTRSYDVKLMVQNPSHALLPGMICNVDLKQATTLPASVTLPANIVQIDIDNRTFVWTLRDGKAHKAYITTGENVGNDIVVTAGLSPSDKVIVCGQQKVSEGTAVKEK